MGYTHYWYVDPVLPEQEFRQIGSDFRDMIPMMAHLGIPLGDGFGEGRPVITDREISFNGLKNCGHTKAQTGLMWPESQAKGISQQKVIAGLWCAGHKVQARTCGGDCSYESVNLKQRDVIPDYLIRRGRDRLFAFCKTNYKPYDFAVQVFLVICKHQLRGKIQVSSDGTDANWDEARQFCQHFLEYGADFVLEDDL